MADRGEQADLIAQFSSVTGTDTERATFYLSMSGWDLQIALSGFYDEQQENLSDDDNDVDYKPAMEMPQKTSKQPTRTSNITTFSSLNVGDDDEQDSDDEEGQAFYAGGSEHSGQQIVGPPRKKNEKKRSDVTQNIFDAAKKHGAEVVDPGQEESRRNKKSSAFKGSGYRLGETESDSMVVKSTSATAMDTEPMAVNLTFWSNGFSVDDGPLRDTSGAENQEFLDSVKRGEIPRELLRLNRGGEVHVNMVDKRHEEYVQPKQTRKAFTGAGHTLGSPAPKVVTSDQKTKPVNVTTTPGPTLNLDNAAPMTNLQIRLADGTRLVSKFNHTHKISDIRNFVTASRPQSAGRHFVLMTTFPNKELTEETQTLEEAKLLNAVIVQRFK